MITKSLRSAVAAALLASTMFATPLNAAPIAATVNSQPKLPTYTAKFYGLTPAATATDVVVLTGSATKTVRLVEFKCTGNSTAAASTPVQLIVRTTADTGGTAVTAPTIYQHNTTDPAATAVLSAYSANPTVGTSGGILDSGLLLTLAPASANVNGIDFLYAQNQISEIRKDPTLVGVANQIAFSFNGGTIPAGLTNLACSVTWTEN